MNRLKPVWRWIGLALIICIIGCDKQSQEQGQRKAVDPINWLHDIDQGLATAQQVNRPLMIDFTAEWCPPCQKMEKETFSDPQVIAKAAHFVMVRIDVDQQKAVAEKYNGNAAKYGGIGIPNILFLSQQAQELRHIIGFHTAEELITVMDSVVTGQYENHD